MGLKPKETGGPLTISTTPTTVESTGYYYHHITIFFTHTFGASDSYELVQYKYDPVLGDYRRMLKDIVDYEAVGSTGTASLQDRTWEMNPTPGDGVKIVLTKLAGNNGTINYEIVKAT